MLNICAFVGVIINIDIFSFSSDYGFRIESVHYRTLTRLKSSKMQLYVKHCVISTFYLLFIICQTLIYNRSLPAL